MVSLDTSISESGDTNLAEFIADRLTRRTHAWVIGSAARTRPPEALQQVLTEREF